MHGEGSPALKGTAATVGVITEHNALMRRKNERKEEEKRERVGGRGGGKGKNKQENREK